MSATLVLSSEAVAEALGAVSCRGPGDSPESGLATPRGALPGLAPLDRLSPLVNKASSR